MEGDARSFRVALVADALVNPASGGVDALPVLEAEGFGVIQLPADAYPEAVAAPLLEQAAEQAEEFVRHGYVVVLVGAREGLVEALAAYGVAPPLACAPATAEELHAFLRAAAGGVPGA